MPGRTSGRASSVAVYYLVARDSCRRGIACGQCADGDVNLRHGTVLEALLNSGVFEFVAQQLAAKPGFEFLQLPVNVRGLVLIAYDIFAVALQEVANRLDANPNRSGRLVFVDVLEAKI